MEGILEASWSESQARQMLVAKLTISVDGNVGLFKEPNKTLILKEPEPEEELMGDKYTRLKDHLAWLLHHAREGDILKWR